MSKVPYPHPGVILEEEFLKRMKITAYRLAKEIHVPQPRISAILKGERSVTADTALRLSRYFGLSESFWMNLQAEYDRRAAKAAIGKELASIRPLEREAALKWKGL